MKYYIAKIVEAKSIKDALKKEKEIEPFEVSQITQEPDKKYISTIGFRAPLPKEE